MTRPALPLSARLRPFLAALALLLAALRPGLAAEVTLEASDLVPVPGGWLAVGLDLPEPDDTLPAVGEGLDEGATSLLRRLIVSGAAHGFGGIVYDNRDRAHSPLRTELFPRLARLVYGPELREQGADNGLAGAIMLPAVTVGNSSTAVTGGPLPRSLARLAMTSNDGPAAVARLYRANALYVYPEHRDHDTADLFPAAWPYMVISQGSSYSDKGFVQALLAAAAAFPPETFEALRAKHLVAPTLQAILRRNLQGVNRREDYFTAAAHPTVFWGRDVRTGRMVSHAAGMTADEIPPMVRLDVVSETFAETAGLGGASERFFDTPQAVARLWRGFGREREMVVSAARTIDPNGRDLTFSWVLLRGDPALVDIEPLGPAGSQARIRVRWHDPWEVPAIIDKEPATRRLSRVDIAVIADNGAEPSAPAFVSVKFPDHQLRTYEDGPDGPRLATIDYDAEGRGAAFDPVLFWSAPWTDTALYDESGTLTGWRRQEGDGPPREIPAEGTRYGLGGDPPGNPVLIELPTEGAVAGSAGQATETAN